MGGELETKSAGRGIIDMYGTSIRLMDARIVDGTDCLSVLLVEYIMCIDS